MFAASFQFLEKARQGDALHHIETLGNTEILSVEQHFQRLLFLASSGQLHHALLVVVGVCLGILILLALVLLILVFSGRTLGTLIKAGIEKYDREVIGTDVTMDNLEIALYTGKVWIRNLKVHNPKPYEAEYLLQAGEVVVDLDVLTLLLSGFKNITAQTLLFKDVDVIWEKSGMFHSNVKQTVDFMEKQCATPTDKEGKGTLKSETSAKAMSDKKASEGAKKEEDTTLTIHQLHIEDVGVKMASKLLHGAGMRLEVADIHYDRFSEEVKDGYVCDVIRTIAQSFLKSVIANTAGKALSDSLF